LVTNRKSTGLQIEAQSNPVVFFSFFFFFFFFFFGFFYSTTCNSFYYNLEIRLYFIFDFMGQYLFNSGSVSTAVLEALS
jgi:hypothetical protein